MTITRVMFELGIGHEELVEEQRRIHMLLAQNRDLAFSKEEIAKLLNKKFQGEYKTKRRQAILYYALERLVEAGAVAERFIASKEDLYYAYRADLSAL